MAAPMVSGSAALVWSMNPALTAPEVRNILLTSTTVQAYGVGGGSQYTYPMLNVGAAVQAVRNKTADSEKAPADEITLAPYVLNQENLDRLDEIIKNRK